MAASSASSVVTAPPSPVVTILRGWKDRQPASPSDPHGTPRYRAPRAPAASSSRATSCGTAVWSSSQSSGRPKRWTPITARVRPVTAPATSSGRTQERLRVDVDQHRSRSAERARRWRWRETCRRARRPRRRRRRRARGARGAAPRSRRRRRRRRRCRRRPRLRVSKAATRGPIVSWPSASTSAIAASSASPTSGRASRISSLTPPVRRAAPGTRRSCARDPGRARRPPASPAPRAPSRRRGCAAPRRRSAAAGRRSRRCTR